MNAIIPDSFYSITHLITGVNIATAYSAYLISIKAITQYTLRIAVG